jgi:hypothetical protein
MHLADFQSSVAPWCEIGEEHIAVGGEDRTPAQIEVIERGNFRIMIPIHEHGLDAGLAAEVAQFLQLFPAYGGAGFHEQLGGIPIDDERADPLEQRAQLAGIREKTGRMAEVQIGDDANGLGCGIQRMSKVDLLQCYRKGRENQEIRRAGKRAVGGGSKSALVREVLENRLKGKRRRGEVTA